MNTAGYEMTDWTAVAEKGRAAGPLNLLLSLCWCGLLPGGLRGAVLHRFLHRSPGLAFHEPGDGE